MAGTVTVPQNQDLRVFLKWANPDGPVFPSPGKTTCASSDAAVCSGADVAADDTSIVIRTVAEGMCTITVDSSRPPSMSGFTVVLQDFITVIVTEPTPTHLIIDPESAMLVTKGEPA